MSDLENLLIDLRTLVCSTKEDYQKKCWTTYPNHIAEFNRILLLTEEMGLASDLEPIQSVPLGNLAYRGAVGWGTQAEQAKLRELVDKSERLLSRVLLFRGEIEGADKATEPFTILERICSRFHLVARQLRNRRESRKTLEVKDEYDAQDLLHSLLWLFFEDIRPEEWTPSYAGASSRMDFLLKKEKMVIEIKKTRNGLGDKEIGEQLLIDIEKYSKYPDCRTLVCFVYDPEGRIGNPRGIEEDLMLKRSEEIEVLVFIRPTGQ